LANSNAREHLMQCPRCQAENRDGRRFCGECGAALVVVCSACAFANEGGEKFCGGCGAPLGTSSAASAPPPVPQPKFSAPDSYTPQHLAERILTSRGALEGERKQVTVLFADLKGSMELLADRNPEEARRILDPVLERMMEAVHRYEGTVNQVMGDGIMALFGAPLAHEDHAVRACYAALRMQEAVKQYADEVRRREGVLIQIRVGLNSGEVVVRSIGSDLHMDYTAVGQTTHLAARMEQLAGAGAILLAPNTLQLAEGYVQAHALGPMQVKGLSEPVEVYELTGAGAARSRLHAAAARGLTKFVGRDAELETLRRTLEQAGAGHGQVVALVGEPGVGKSRLVWEFGHSHRAQGWLVLESRSVSYGKATSYLPVIDLLKSYCGVDAWDDARRIREKLTGKLLALDPALHPTLPALLALLDVPVEDPAWQALDPPQRRSRTLDALKRLLLRESQEQPLLLVFEDLHWIDAETQALLDSLVDSLPTARLLLLVNYRPEYEHAWHRKTYYQQLRLDPLPAESAEELLAALLGDAAELQPLKRALLARTEGNPFFVEESVRTLVESAVLAGERGAYQLARPFEQTHVPATVQTVLAARIDRLAPEDKRLLQAAAVIGKDVPYPLLFAIAELSDSQLRDGLTRLQAAEFLYETSLYPEPEYTFKHALTHEVAYGSLLQERRRALHARIVAGIETLYAERLPEHVERLAHHALHGELWDAAADYLRQSGLKAESRGARREAAGYLEQALTALQHLPDTRETRAQSIDLRLDLRGVLTPLAENQRLLDHLRAAEALADSLGDQRRQGEVAASLTRCLMGLGDNAGAVEAGRRAIEIATELGDIPLAATTRFRLGEVLVACGRYREAGDLVAENASVLQGDLLLARWGATVTSAGSLGTLAWSLAELGEFADGVAQGEAAVRIAQAAAHPFTLAQAYNRLGHVRVLQGDVEQAILLLQQAEQIAQEGHTPSLLLLVATNLGHAELLAGRVGDALTTLERAAQQVLSIQDTRQHSLLLVRLGECYLVAGRSAEAINSTSRALALARERQERGSEAYAARLLGEIAASADPPDAEQAESYYREALALADELGMRPLAAHCHLGLGTLYRRLGRDEVARAELATAAEMYRAMEMPFWLARAEAALAGAV
jgi:class 3 adenylate cyclase/tetratricopeptide (TPR) repeat protein